MYRFINAETKELLAIMPDGTWEGAKAEQERLMDECECIVLIVEGE